MKAEIKDAINSLADALVKGIGSHLKDEETATIEEIKQRNVNIALLKIEKALTTTAPRKNGNFR
jgi:hypothetical protein